MDKVFADSDVILDLLQERQPFFGDALEFFSLVEENALKAFVSPLIFANLYYILRRAESRARAIQLLLRLKAIVKVLTIGEKTIDLALSSSFKDFEDAIQYYAALEAGLDYLVTRNKEDYGESGLVICAPREYLAIRQSRSKG
jgi:predicted nucleic acid-binding protein